MACGCACFFKAIIWIFCLPFLLLLSLFGAVIWLFFKLIKCLCCLCPCCNCCIGCVETAADIFLGIMKLPFKMLKWVTGA